MSMLGMTGPGFSTQQLHRYQIALVHSFDLGRDIDQTVGLHHGGQDSGPLSAGRADLENTLFLREHTAKKVASIRPFGKLLLEDSLHDRSTVSPVSAHLEHRR